jgi:hypothetical protein
MKYIRLVKYKKIDGKDLIDAIYEFEGGLENGQVFRKGSGTCTRLFSRQLRECIKEGDFVMIEKGEN